MISIKKYKDSVDENIRVQNPIIAGVTFVPTEEVLVSVARYKTKSRINLLLPVVSTLGRRNLLVVLHGDRRKPVDPHHVPARYNCSFCNLMRNVYQFEKNGCEKVSIHAISHKSC